MTPDRWLQEGDVLTLGRIASTCCTVRGTRLGHVVFVNHAARFALVGDVLFQGSVGRTDFPYGDHAALITAIKTKLLPLGDDFSFLCGHGPGRRSVRNGERTLSYASEACLLLPGAYLELSCIRADFCYSSGEPQRTIP